MIVKCVANSGKNRPGIYRTLGYTNQLVFHVSPGKEYVVQSMALWGLHLVLLLADDAGRPNWFPAVLFRVVNPHLPPDWAYDIARHDSRGLRAIWGYKEIVQNKQHNDALIDRDPDALRLFAQIAAATPMEIARAL